MEVTGKSRCLVARSSRVDLARTGVRAVGAAVAECVSIVEVAMRGGGV